MIAIIDYGAGNLHSVKNALDFLNAESIVTGDSETILNADKVILPGVGAFGDADELILTHIYAAREKFDGVTKPENLAEDIKKRGVNAQYIDKFEDIAEFLKKNVKEGDIVFTMGAGDVVNINKLIVE